MRQICVLPRTFYQLQQLRFIRWFLSQDTAKMFVYAFNSIQFNLFAMQVMQINKTSIQEQTSKAISELAP